MKTRYFSHKPGFTMIEILTTITVIAILMALLVPALGHISKMTQRLKQGVQLNTVGMAIEGYNSEAGSYPPSTAGALAAVRYCGAQKLAEALIGMDGFGVHEDTLFNLNGVDILGNSLYLNSTPVAAGVDVTKRLGLYLELETANAVMLNAIFDIVPQAGTSIPRPDAYILTDTYKIVKNRVTGKDGGMPILYFRADSSKTLHDGSVDGAFNSLCTYDVGDNMDIINMGTPGGAVHPMHSDPMIFYEATRNPNFGTDDPATWRPYRAASFILLSAGPDGLYGTSDDIYNFDLSQN